MADFVRSPSGNHFEGLSQECARDIFILKARNTCKILIQSLGWDMQTIFSLRN